MSIETKANRRVVTSDYERPARQDGTCFYCRAPIGELHLEGCVGWKKTFIVEINHEFEIEHDAPHHWTVADLVEYFEGSGIQYLWGQIEEEGGRGERWDNTWRPTNVRL